jgi:hypothetical protein
MKLKSLSTARVLVMLAPLAVLTGCLLLGPSEMLKATSKALLEASEKCVYEVRDQRLKYEMAPNCAALGALSSQYINAGGGRTDTPLEVEINFERARVHAWMARALSESREPGLLRIWWSASMWSMPNFSVNPGLCKQRFTLAQDGYGERYPDIRHYPVETIDAKLAGRAADERVVPRCPRRVVATVIGFVLAIMWDMYKMRTECHERTQVALAMIAEELAANNQDRRTQRYNPLLRPWGLARKEERVQPLSLLKTGFWDVTRVSVNRGALSPKRLMQLRQAISLAEQANEEIRSRGIYVSIMAQWAISTTT